MDPLQMPLASQKKCSAGHRPAWHPENFEAGVIQKSRFGVLPLFEKGARLSQKTFADCGGERK